MVFICFVSRETPQPKASPLRSRRGSERLERSAPLNGIFLNHEF